MASTGPLWKYHCYQLGKQEGVGDLSQAMEIASGLTTTLTDVKNDDHSAVNWKLVYRELFMLMSQIKELVLKKAKDEMKDQVVEEVTKLSTLNVAIKQNLTLQEMLQICA